MKLLGSLLLIAILVGAIGVAAGWFRFTTETRAGGTKVSLEIDEDEIAADAAAAKDRIGRTARDLVERAEGAGGAVPEVRGTLTAVETASFTLRRADGATVSFLFDPATVIEIGGAAAGRADLLVGDLVVVTDAGGDSKADRIVVER